MKSTLQHISKETPKLYKNLNETVVVLVNKIHSDGTMQGIVVYSRVSKYQIGDYYDNWNNIFPFDGAIILSNN